MKKVNSLGMCALLLATLLLCGAARAWDFTYGFENVTASNADLHVVGLDNARKYVEWQDPPETYWGSPASGLPGKVTMRFDFPEPTKEVFVKAELFAANHGYYYGKASLWASKDGTTWELLLDNPTPDGNGAVERVYSESVPESLLGSRTFWLQARLQQWNCPPAVTDGQFCRLIPNKPGNQFEVKARFGDGGEAEAGPSVAGGPVPTGRPAWSLVSLVLVVPLAAFACMLSVAALVCALALRNRPQTAALQGLQQQLGRLAQRVGRLEQRAEDKPA